MDEIELKVTTRSASTLSRLMLFAALSRTRHGVMELATPSLAALLYLGFFPDFTFIGLGLLTAFAGYTSVYALNDMMDLRLDRLRLETVGYLHPQMFLESGLDRHPVAQGRLSRAGGYLWVALWALIALVGAWILNPVCALIFLLGAALEAAYCLMLKVSPARTLVHGVVKTCGAMAALFAVSSNPDWTYAVALFFWLYFWEVGGQNIPADWHDLEEDKILEAKTVPLKYGQRIAGLMILGALCLSVALSVLLFLVSPADPHPVFALMALAVGIVMLIVPALRLLGTLARPQVCSLFTMASYYPPAVLAVVILSLVFA